MLLLADDFWFVAHDSISMRRRLSDRAMGIGLAAALLGEQVLLRKINVRGGQLRVVDKTPPADALSHTVLDQLCADPDVPVRDWLLYLSRTAYHDVARRLIREGHLHERPVRRLLRVTTTYEPDATTRAGWPESRLAHRLVRSLPLEFPDVVLAGLVDATNLDSYLLADMPSGARRYLRHLLDGLPPALRDLIGETGAAVGDAVLNART